MPRFEGETIIIIIIIIIIIVRYRDNLGRFWLNKITQHGTNIIPCSFNIEYYQCFLFEAKVFFFSVSTPNFFYFPFLFSPVYYWPPVSTLVKTKCPAKRNVQSNASIAVSCLLR